jgi:hypothetical protein
MKRFVILIVLTSVVTGSAFGATFKNVSTKVEDGVGIRVGSAPLPGRPNLKAGEEKVIDVGSSAVEIYIVSVGSDRKTVRHHKIASFPSLAATDVVTCKRDGLRLTCSK